MNKSSTVGSLVKVLGIVALVGYGLSLISIVSTIFNTDIVHENLCLTAKCLEHWSKAVEYPLAMAKSTSDFLVAIATVGGIIVALLSYFSSVDNAALSNHISHYSTFQGYVNSEVSKRTRIHPSSVDTFLWYNLIFPMSKVGKMEVSQQYKNFMDQLNQNIQLANGQIQKATEESFRYKPHQERIKKELLKIGIRVHLQPRIEFFEIEGEIFSLLTCVNQAFCSSNDVPEISQRSYI